MAINNISLNRGGGNVSMVSIGQQPSELQSINAIVGSIRDDIKHIKNQFDNLPPVPEGKYHHNLFVINISFYRSKTADSIGSLPE